MSLVMLGRASRGFVKEVEVAADEAFSRSRGSAVWVGAPSPGAPRAPRAVMSASAWDVAEGLLRAVEGTTDPRWRKLVDLLWPELLDLIRRSRGMAPFAASEDRVRDAALLVLEKLGTDVARAGPLRIDDERPRLHLGLVGGDAHAGRPGQHRLYGDLMVVGVPWAAGFHGKGPVTDPRGGVLRPCSAEKNRKRQTTTA
jgi:hypothetical protein